jgi:redox-sensitive bicupin YhaK (pirin superfamily)
VSKVSAGRVLSSMPIKDISALRRNSTMELLNAYVSQLRHHIPFDVQTSYRNFDSASASSQLRTLRQLNNQMSNLRSIAKVIPSHKQKEGGGFIVRRPLPSPFIPEGHIGGLWLLIDEMGPIHYAPGEAKGAPAHPHLGQCTFTYMLKGEMQHKDSSGGRGEMRAGATQYMRASGTGIVHSEMPSETIMKNGGVVHGFQIWLNLPSRYKKSLKPIYQDISANDNPIVQVGNGFVKPLLGSFNDIGSKVKVDMPGTTLLDVMLGPGETLNLKVPIDAVGFLYCYLGQVTIDQHVSPIVLEEGKCGILGEKENDGENLCISNTTQRDTQMEYEMTPGPRFTKFLVGYGPAIAEPVSRHGPFVMNSRQEIIQAVTDYQSGKMGMILD